MATPQGVVPSDGAVTLFNAILRASYARIFATFEDASLTTKQRRAAIMKQIEEIANETNLDLSAWANVSIPAFYEQGLFEGMKDLFERGSPVIMDASFANFHKEAIQALAESGIADIASGMQGMVKTAQRLVSDATRRAVLDQVATGQVLGETRKEITKNIVKTLKEDGISSLVDKKGRTWELSRYGSMLARTKLTQAHNTGTVNRMAESGYDLVQVSDHQGECELCRPWENEILSVSGRHGKHKSLAQAENAGLFHPNCRHVITPVQSEFLDVAVVWDTRKKTYVPYTEKMSKAMVEKAENQTFKELVATHQDVVAKIGIRGVSDFQRAVDAGNKTKAKAIANELPDTSPVKASMLRLINFI